VNSLSSNFFSIREITKAVAAAVVREAIREGQAEGYRDKDSRDMAEMSEVRQHRCCSFFVLIGVSWSNTLGFLLPIV
jgi:malic enzyme